MILRLALKLYIFFSLMIYGHLFKLDIENKDILAVSPKICPSFMCV